MIQFEKPQYRIVLRLQPQFIPTWSQWKLFDHLALIWFIIQRESILLTPCSISIFSINSCLTLEKALFTSNLMATRPPSIARASLCLANSIPDGVIANQFQLILILLTKRLLSMEWQQESSASWTYTGLQSCFPSLSSLCLSMYTTLDLYSLDLSLIVTASCI
ncbi:Hypothetical_protein [Hexamita inflata]|uniref:Hypothetical_protein n=1 Tax=Hexamita inflata TaxID=28002 RepID=A0AA86NGE4_9EUKA|nr:Hypothetical protein HINF_LOCUS6431 [Hexamita inflata]